MAKIEKASDDVKLLFEEVREETTIPQWVEFEVLANNSQKDLYKIVKLNEIIETITEGLNFAVVINEEIFEQLPDDMKKTALAECLAGVCVDENDKVSLEKPNFSTYRGILAKYGHDPIIVLHESIKSLFDSKKQKEDEEKSQKKAKKSKKTAEAV